MEGIRIDQCAQCGREDIDTVNLLCLGCTRANEEGGEMAGFGIGNAETGNLVAYFTDTMGTEWEVGVRGGGDTDLGIWSELHSVGVWLNPASAAFLEAILAEYRRSGQIPQVLPIPASAAGVEPPVTQDLIEAMAGKFQAVEDKLGDLGAALRELQSGRSRDLEREEMTSVRLSDAEMQIADLYNRQDGSDERQAATRKRLEAVEEWLRLANDRLNNHSGWLHDLSDSDDSRDKWQKSVEERLAVINKTIGELEKLKPVASSYSWPTYRG